MANSGLKVTTEELRKVLTALKNERDTIQKTYTSQIKGVLESSESCFQVSGLDYSTITSTINNTFTTLNSNFNSLIDVLENDVIKNYDDLAAAIRAKFGQEFAARITSLIGK